MDSPTLAWGCDMSPSMRVIIIVYIVKQFNLVPVQWTTTAMD